MDELSEDDKLTVSRARKIQRFLSQPFQVAEVFTGHDGKLVPLKVESLSLLVLLLFVMLQKLDSIWLLFFLPCRIPLVVSRRFLVVCMAWILHKRILISLGLGDVFSNIVVFTLLLPGKSSMGDTVYQYRYYLFCCVKFSGGCFIVVSPPNSCLIFVSSQVNSTTFPRSPSTWLAPLRRLLPRLRDWLRKLTELVLFLCKCLRSGEAVGMLVIF